MPTELTSWDLNQGVQLGQPALRERGPFGDATPQPSEPSVSHGCSGSSRIRLVVQFLGANHGTGGDVGVLRKPCSVDGRSCARSTPQNVERYSHLWDAPVPRLEKA